MYTCQCKGCQFGQNSGVLLKEVAAFQRFHCKLYVCIQVRNEDGQHRCSVRLHVHWDEG